LHMPIKNICDLTEKIKTTYQEKDLKRLARCLDIVVAYRPLGKKPAACKGFYIVINKIKHITINCNLHEDDQHIILSHEIGHAVLDHKADELKDFHLFDASNYMEIEANLFSAELQISDDDVIENATYGYSFWDIARALYVYPELLAYKFYSMQNRGYNKLNNPINVKSDFLKSTPRQRLQVAETDGFYEREWYL